MPVFKPVKAGISAYSVLMILFSCSGEVSAGKVMRMDVEHFIEEQTGNGQWTVVNVWAPDCPPCVEEMPDLASFHERHRDGDARVAGIAVGFPDYGDANEGKVREFVEDYFIEFPVLLGDGSASFAIEAAPLQGLPTTYVYSPQGVLVARQVGMITSEVLENYMEKQRGKKITE